MTRGSQFGNLLGSVIMLFYRFVALRCRSKCSDFDASLNHYLDYLCAFVQDLGLHLRRSQEIACDGLVEGFDEPMLRLLCGLPAVNSAGLSAVSSTECGVACVHAAKATIACA